MGLFSGGSGFSLPGMDLLNKGYDVLTGRKGYDKAADNIRFQPFNIRSGFGNTTWSGNEGSFSLNPEYQSIRDEALGSAKGFFSQAKTFDPNAASSNAYNLMQQIAAPGRERSLFNLRDTLYGQGRLGAADATGGNPELRAFFEAQNQMDLQSLLQSIGIGQNLLDSTIARGTGFLGLAGGLDSQGNSLFDVGLKAGAGSLRASEKESEYMAKSGEAESSFWNNLIGSAGKGFGIPGFPSK